MYLEHWPFGRHFPSKGWLWSGIWAWQARSIGGPYSPRMRRVAVYARLMILRTEQERKTLVMNILIWLQCMNVGWRTLGEKNPSYWFYILKPFPGLSSRLNLWLRLPSPLDSCLVESLGCLRKWFDEKLRTGMPCLHLDKCVFQQEKKFIWLKQSNIVRLIDLHRSASF